MSNENKIQSSAQPPKHNPSVTMSFTTHLWDQLDPIQKRVHDSSESLKTCIAFVKEFAALNDDYASSLRKLVKNHDLAGEYDKNQTLPSFMSSLSGCVDSIAQHSAMFAKRMHTEVYEILLHLHRSYVDSTHKAITDAHKWEKILKASDSTLEQARTYSKEVCALSLEMRKQLQESLGSTDASAVKALQSKSHTVDEKVLHADKRVFAAIRQHNVLYHRWTKGASKALSTLQREEVERIEVTSQCMHHFTSLWQQYSSTVLDVTKGVDDVLKDIDARKDVFGFIVQHRSTVKRPTEAKFEVYPGHPKYNPGDVISFMSVEEGRRSNEQQVTGVRGYLAPEIDNKTSNGEQQDNPDGAGPS